MAAAGAAEVELEDEVESEIEEQGWESGNGDQGRKLMQMGKCSKLLCRD